MENNSTFPLLGEKFPTLNVKTTQGQMTLPDAYAGKWFVLFSHPSDFTPVCTTEFIGFAKAADEFNAIGADLIGLSIDGVHAHMKWIEWIDEHANVKIPFPIIADELGRAASQLGMLHSAMGTNTVRAVFIVDDKGVLRLTMYYPQEVGRSIDEILRATKALQTADKYSVAIPENWPNNEFIGDHGIVPPASTIADAEKRKAQANEGDTEYLDWWFVHKPIK
ncbi:MULTISPECIES: peroxiredoxin [Erysipelothrix]|uniref:Peroxiredoxin n=1 Tax=Erysipelothrix piscisicarius TaxID=2485784 RepID=A0A3S8RPB8_9FIRM|nr:MULTISPECIES: peroxiredoxin [Erysipelothrix]AZK44709.1 peroxiredoxin [Erysipelothrix piscisicarius]MBK2403003.1 peroxiredoxin [Erysipelothrix sp. strain 2 (EsS2-6-Brazil)]MBK2403501.1 peroxiredoxin [Erysipelothrix sp. strain 2 (EsS2-7-Brazil)]NBA01546.1 peroxiredoxin [Erysipelothrix rhusiopathiae]